MESYNLEYEQNTLNKNWEQSASHSMMTTIIGCRIGKKAAIQQEKLTSYGVIPEK